MRSRWPSRSSEAEGSRSSSSTTAPPFGETIERSRPDYAKALVQYNPEADAKINALSRDRLRRLSRWLRDGGPQFLLELLVPATAEQLRSVGGDSRRYDAELRAGLMVRAISQLQADGISPHVWKVEGLDTLDDCRVVAEQCRSVTPDTSCIVLGRGASIDQVRSWLTMAGQAGGYNGFAVGRSIWLAPLTAHLAGRADRAVTAARIGMTYQSLTRVFAQAAGGGR